MVAFARQKRCWDLVRWDSARILGFGPAEAPPTAPSTAPIAPAADEGDDAFSGQRRETLSKLKDPDSPIIRDAMIRARGKPASLLMIRLRRPMRSRRGGLTHMNSSVERKAAIRCSGYWYLELGSQRSTTPPLW